MRKKTFVIFIASILILQGCSGTSQSSNNASGQIGEYKSGQTSAGQNSYGQGANNNTSSYYQDGTASTYKKMSFQIDPSIFYGDVHEKGFTYAYLLSHEVTAPTDKKKKIGDPGTADDIKGMASKVDPNGIYHISIPFTSQYVFWSNTIGWAKSGPFLDTKNAQYDFSGFEKCYWTINERKSGNNMRDIANDIYHEVLFDRLYTHRSFFGETNIYGVNYSDFKTSYESYESFAQKVYFYIHDLNGLESVKGSDLGSNSLAEFKGNDNGTLLFVFEDGTKIKWDVPVEFFLGYDGTLVIAFNWRAGSDVASYRAIYSSDNNSDIIEAGKSEFENYFNGAINPLKGELPARKGGRNNNRSDDDDYTDIQTERDYIIPESSTVLLTEDDLEDLTAKELTYARNEVYARHGYVFDVEELRNYFSSKSWYSPGNDNSEIKINRIEEANVKLVKEYQEKHGLTYAPWNQESGRTYSDEELCKLAVDYFYSKHGSRPPIVEVESRQGNEALVHLYYDMGDHTATADWYTIDLSTGETTNVLGEVFYLFD